MEELRPTHEELLRRCEAAEATLAAIRSGKTNGKQGERETWVLRTTELEQRSEHIKNVLLAIRNVNQIIVAETDRQQLIEKVCAVLTETMGYFQAWVALLGGDGKTVSMTAFSGFDGGFQEMRQLLERGQYPDCLSRAIASATTIVIQNPEIQCPECPLVSQYGGRSGLAHRLAFDSKVYGVLAVSVPAAYAYDEEEQKFFEELANDLAFALQRMEIIQARRDAEEQYRLALFGGDLGTWDWNIQTGEVIFNTRWAEMLGYELDEIEPHIRSWEKLVHPDDMPDVMQALNAHLEGKTDTYEIEHRLLHKSGEWVWVLDKGRVFTRDAEGKPIRACGTHLDVTRRKHTEEALKASEETSRSIIKRCPMGIHLYSLEDDSRLVFAGANPAADQILGVDNAQFIGKTIEEAFPPLVQTEIPDRYRRAARDGDIWQTEETQYEHGAIKGSFEVHAFQISPGKVAVLFNDTTERKTLEAQLLQAQKMESIGRLAGGVAHDFNNMLNVILGHAELAVDQIDPMSPLFGDIQEIRKAAKRSADLTRQLLAFARKQTISPKELDLNDAVEAMLTMLRRLIGENIDLVWLPGARASRVRIDPSQLDQILANLCVNARDAIGEVGKVTIETANVAFDEEYCASHVDFTPGNYVMIAFSDNGCGMEKQTLAHIFEPFFTTKDIGKGTGLGLATVYGIVKQNEGFVNVYSEPGHGTTFKIYLPRLKAPAEQDKTEKLGKTAQGGTETLLVVEDEPSILNMSVIMLKKMGYRVLSAGSPLEAIRVAENCKDEIHLLMTDVVMPEMNGRELAQQLQAKFPGLKRLFVSGYTENVIAHHGVLEPGVFFLQKPFSKDELACALRRVLDA